MELLNTKTIFHAVAVIAFFAAIYFGTKGASWNMFLFAALFLVFGNLDRVEEFRIGKEGLATKTRELTETIKEAKSTINELQLLAVLLAKTTLSSVQMAGRMGGFQDDKKEAIKNETIDVLRKIGVSEDQIAEALSDWYPYVEFDYASSILGGSYILQDVPPEHRAAQEKLIKRVGIAGRPTPDQIAEFFKNAGILTEQRKELIEDYRHYVQHREHRRPDVWKNRADWYPHP